MVAHLEAGEARLDRLGIALGGGPPITRERPAQGVCEVNVILLPGTGGLASVPAEDETPLDYRGASWRVRLFAEGPAGRKEKAVVLSCEGADRWMLEGDSPARAEAGPQEP